jgi:hypothetical protein
MKIRFYISEEKGRELDVAKAMQIGMSRDVEFEAVPNRKWDGIPDPSIDLVCVFALKGNAKSILTRYRVMGCRTLLVDKGLIRASTGLGAPVGYYRVSLDAFMPIKRIERMMSERIDPSRWLATGMAPQDRVPRDEGLIVYCGSSQKYCDFHGLGDEHDYAEAVIKMIRKRVGPKVKLIYRPKPSFAEATPIEGTEFSRPPINLANHLRRARCLVTHGSHSGIDAILAGVPAICLGPCAAVPVSSTSIDVLRGAAPYFYPDRVTRFHWLAALGWWQWRESEMRDGSMWRWLRGEMEREIYPFEPEPEESLDVCSDDL